MIKHEQRFNTLFLHWLKEVYLSKHNFFAGAFELKDTRGRSSLNFNEIKDHQIEALKAVKGRGLVYKLSDISMVQQPFDCIAFSNCPAYVVIKYPQWFCLIDIDTFLLEKKRSVRKSLLASRAKELALITVNL